MGDLTPIASLKPVKLPHTLRQMAIRCIDYKMVMVIH